MLFWNTVVTVAVLLVSPGALAASQQQPSSSSVDVAQHNVDVVREGFERWATGGAFFADVVDPDVRWIVHGTGPAAKTYVDHMAYVREFVRPLSARLIQQVAPRIRDLVAKDDVVIAIWDGESMARDGVLYQNQYVWVFRMLGTKAIEVEVFLDLERYYDVLRRVPLAGAQAN